MHLDSEGYARHPALQCPYCTKTMDAAAVSPGHAPAMPRTGDTAICLDCANASIYEVGPLGVALRKPSPEERAEILAECGSQIAQLLEFNERFPRRPRR
jgi:hypothetical protein